MKRKQNHQGPARGVDATGEPVTLDEFNGFEIYPMPMFATLAVTEVSRVARWYADALGFRTVFQAPVVNGQPSLVHLRRGKYQDLLIVPASGAAAKVPASSLTLSFQTDDVDALAAQARAAESLGASAIEAPVDTPWNTRDLRVTDPAGHRLVFTSRQANPNPKQAERWSKIFAAARKAESTSD